MKTLFYQNQIPTRKKEFGTDCYASLLFWVLQASYNTYVHRTSFVTEASFHTKFIFVPFSLAISDYMCTFGRMIVNTKAGMILKV
jgi:hypothetical protein